MHEMMIANQHFEELNPILFGKMKCVPGHHFGPVIRDFVLIHYVEDGHGILCKNNTTYQVHKGQAFIILPGEWASYAADKKEPWKYRWIAFNGKLSSKYNSLPPVIEISDQLFPNVEEHQDVYTEYILTSQLFKMTAELFAEEKQENQYVRKVKNYIKYSYMNTIRIEEIAKAVSLDRYYLSRIFKKETGKTMQEYLLGVRMKHACALLSDGVSISEAATLCGYPDVSSFSKMFKRIYGETPSNYRKYNQKI